MPDRVRKIWDSISEWWKRFTRRQQVIIASSVAIVAIAIGILSYVLTRPELLVIKSCESTKEAASVKELLDGQNIYNEVSDDGLEISIKKKDESTARLLLGSNEIATDDPDLDKVFEGGLSTTEADKTKRYQAYMQEYFANIVSSIPSVDSATVVLDIPVDDGTLIMEQQEASASVYLALNEEIDEEQAAGIAKMIATQLGNETTDNISIMDTNTMTLLFAGGRDNALGAMSAQLSTKQKLASQIKGEVKKVILGTGLYNDAEVGLNLSLNSSDRDVVDEEYYVPDGRDQGYYLKDSTYDSETTGSTGGVPGTDSNGEDGTTYVLNNGENSSQTISDSSREYAVSKRTTRETTPGGEIDYTQSSISVSLLRYHKYDEDQLKADGELEDMTFEQYKAQIEQQAKTVLTVEPEIASLVASATGFDPARISVTAVEEPVFVPSSGSGRTLADYLEILLAVLIFALLGFVVFMSMRKDKQAELEPELSVETLLQTTKENEEESLEDIGFKEKSEARVLIEKFVEEKPEAVASLLRNWLNEDWE